MARFLRIVDGIGKQWGLNIPTSVRRQRNEVGAVQLGVPGNTMIEVAAETLRISVFPSTRPLNHSNQEGVVLEDHSAQRCHTVFHLVYLQ